MFRCLFRVLGRHCPNRIAWPRSIRCKYRGDGVCSAGWHALSIDASYGRIDGDTPAHADAEHFAADHCSANYLQPDFEAESCIAEHTKPNYVRPEHEYAVQSFVGAEFILPIDVLRTYADV